MATPELQRKVRQHDNELEAIYEIVSGHSEDLIEIKATLAEHGSMLTEIGLKVDEQGAKLDELLALLRTGTNRVGSCFASTRAAVHSCVVHLVGSKHTSENNATMVLHDRRASLMRVRSSRQLSSSSNPTPRTARHGPTARPPTPPTVDRGQRD